MRRRRALFYGVLGLTLLALTAGGLALSALAERELAPRAAAPAQVTATSTHTPEPWLDISNALPAWCMGAFYGDTTGQANNVEYYGTLTYPYTGPEDVYVLVKTVTSSVTLLLDDGPYDTDLDILLLYDAHPQALLAQGDTQLTYVNLAPGTYYIVIDGYEGDSGPYRLDVQCTGEPTITPTSTLIPTPTNTPMYDYAPLIYKQSTPRPTATRTATRTHTPTTTITRTPTQEATPTNTPRLYEQAVNCGSTEGYQATDGSYYAPDRAYTAGAWGWAGSSAEKVWSNPVQITYTEDDVLYQTQRYTLTAYYFTVPRGRYEVMLRFAEIFQYADPGDRVFAVRIENTPVLDHYDLLAKGSHYRAWDEVFEFNVSDGLLAISFEKQSPEYTPAINGIRIRYIGEPQ